MSARVERRARRGGGLFWGFVLIVLGAYFLLRMYDVLPDGLLHAWWPVFVIAAGLGSMIGAHDPKSFGSGMMVTGIGCWLLVAANDWYGLGWNRSWPLVLVAVGLGSVAEALAARWWRREEDEHVG